MKIIIDFIFIGMIISLPFLFIKGFMIAKNSREVTVLLIIIIVGVLGILSAEIESRG